MAAIMSMVVCCTNTPPPEQGGEKDSLKGTEIVTTLSKPIRDILDLGLPELLGAEVDYDETIPNALDYVQEYLVSDDKAASNLGVFGTDALYFSLYDKTQEYIQYSTSCQRIATEIGVREAFSPQMIRRLENNVGNADSIYSILSESINTADSTLRADGQERLAALIATGSLVEGLHILCQSLSSPGLRAPNVNKLKQAIINQADAVRRVRTRLASLPKDKSLNDLQEKLEKLDAEIATAKVNNTDSLKGVCDLAGSLRNSIIN